MFVTTRLVLHCHTSSAHQDTDCLEEPQWNTISNSTRSLQRCKSVAGEGLYIACANSSRPAFTLDLSHSQLPKQHHGKSRDVHSKNPQPTLLSGLPLVYSCKQSSRDYRPNLSDCALLPSALGRQLFFVSLKALLANNYLQLTNALAQLPSVRRSRASSEI